MIAMQGPIIKTLPSIILGGNASEKTDDESIGFDLSFQVLQAFVRAIISLLSLRHKETDAPSA